MKNREPEILQNGKQFHKCVQADWRKNARGRLFFEFTTNLEEGKKGRMDILVLENESYVAIGEIKNSDWNKMTDIAVKKNARRQIHQIWNYIESKLSACNDVTAGVIFRKRPSDKNRLELIEALFEAEGISVVWNDETSNERKQRAGL